MHFLLLLVVDESAIAALYFKSDCGVFVDSSFLSILRFSDIDHLKIKSAVESEQITPISIKLFTKNKNKRITDCAKMINTMYPFLFFLLIDSS